MLPTYLGRESTITVGEKTYTLGRLDRATLREFAEWVASKQPDPLEVAARHLKDLPPELQKVLLKEAWEAARRRMDIDSPEVREAAQTAEGGCKLLALLLRKHHPDVDEDAAFDIALQHFDAEVNRLAREKGLSREEALTLAPFRDDLQAR